MAQIYALVSSEFSITNNLLSKMERLAVLGHDKALIDNLVRLNKYWKEDSLANS